MEVALVVTVFVLHLVRMNKVFVVVFGVGVGAGVVYFRASGVVYGELRPREEGVSGEYAAAGLQVGSKRPDWDGARGGRRRGGGGREWRRDDVASWEGEGGPSRHLHED
jgi:hypothetical protein